MKKRNLLALGIITTLLLTGCSTSSNAETEELKKQIANLEQQIADIENTAPVTEEKTDDITIIETPEVSSETTAPAETKAPETGSTTSTIDDLAALVDDFVKRADAAAPGSDEAANMETFFTLKKEGNKLENDLDRHEDDLEKLYRNGSLTRDAYRNAEREVERLEDRLDDAEDRLEYKFGIDD